MALSAVLCRKFYTLTCRLKGTCTRQNTALGEQTKTLFSTLHAKHPALKQKAKACSSQLIHASNKRAVLSPFRQMISC